MAYQHGQNAGKQAVEVPDDEFWRDFERLQELPAGFRHWLEFEANDTYLIGSIFKYHTLYRRSFGELEQFMRDYSRQQYAEDYKWTGEIPPWKGKTNEPVPQLRDTLALDRQPRKAPVQVHPRARQPVRRRRTSLTRQPVENDGDYFEW